MRITERTIDKSPGKSSLRGLTTVVIVGLAIVLSALQFRAPSPLPADAPPTEFSAARATKLLSSFAHTPHPVGSTAQAAVRDVLLAELTALGLKPTVQHGIGVNPQWSVAGGPVENIVVHIDGTDSSGTLLLVAHYDSAVTSPGAGDDGSAVAVILESLRALSTEEPLQNDVIVLLTDGEEMLLLGVYAFLNEHPQVAQVRVVINLEACLDGPVALIETGSDDGWFVREFGRAVARPMGFALINEITRFMPRSSDFAPFKEAGFAGGHISGTIGGTRYHTPQDDVEHVNTRTLQSYGSSVLALVRHLGNVNLDTPQAPDTVFFPLFGPFFIHYPLSLAVPLAVVTLGLFIGVLILGVRRKQLAWKEMGLGFLVLVGTLIAAFLLTTLYWQALRRVRPEYAALTTAGSRYNDGINSIAFLALTVSVFSLAYALAGTRIAWPSLAFGALWLWLVLTLTSSFVLPRSSYLFTWPLLFILFHLAWRFGAAGPNRPVPGSWAHAIGSALTAAIGILVWAPVIVLLALSLGMDAAAAVAVLAVLFVSSMLFPLERILAPTHSAPAWRWGLPTAALVVVVVCLVGAISTAGFDAAHPQLTLVRYLLDSDAQRAFWINTPVYLSPWETQFVNEDTAIVPSSEAFPPWGAPIWWLPRVRQSAAKTVSLPAPNVEVLEDSTRSGVRTLRLQITSFRETDMVLFGVAPDTELLAATVHGQPIVKDAALQRRRPGEWFSGLYVSPLPSEDSGWHTRFELVLSIAGSDPIEMVVADRSTGLPDVPGMVIQPRPASVMPANFGDGTFVSKRYVFD